MILILYAFAVMLTAYWFVRELAELFDRNPTVWDLIRVGVCFAAYVYLIEYGLTT